MFFQNVLSQKPMNKRTPYSNFCTFIHMKKQTIFANLLRSWKVCSASVARLKPCVGISLLLLL